MSSFMEFNPSAPFFIAILLFLSPPVRAADPEESCKTLINQALPVWTMASVSEDVKAFVAAELRADPARIQGDFDGDGRQDIAMLIQNRAQPLLQEPDRFKATRIAVCLAKVPSGSAFHRGAVLRRLIYLVKKGEDMFDFEAGKLGKYPADAIGTTCFEKAGEVFLLEGDGFKRIINSD